MPRIIGMEDYRAGFNRTATEEQIEITDAVAWAKDKLNFEADAAQAQILAADAKRGILNCSRQWGKSTTSPSRPCITRTSTRTASSSSPARAFVKARNFSKRAEKAVAQLGIRVRGDGENQCSIQLPNGSRIIGLPESEGTNPRLLRRQPAHDRRSLPRVGRSLHALRPMLAVSGGDPLAHEHAQRQIRLLLPRMVRPTRIGSASRPQPKNARAFPPPSSTRSARLSVKICIARSTAANS